MQFKRHSIGYILKALLDIGTTTTKLRDFYLLLDKQMGNTEEIFISDYDTGAYAIKVAHELSYNSRQRERLASALYQSIDDYSVKDAESFYNAFKVILRF